MAPIIHFYAYRSDVNVLVLRSTKYMVIMLWCFFSSPSFHARSIGIVFRFLILFLTTTVQSSYPRSQRTQCSLALSLSLSLCCCFFRFDNCRSDQFSLCIQLANISNAILFFLQLQQLATTSIHFAFNFILKSYHFSNKLYIISSGYFFNFFYFLLNRYLVW